MLLNNDSLMRIFEYLDLPTLLVVTMTCHRWRMLSQYIMSTRQVFDYRNSQTLAVKLKDIYYEHSKQENMFKSILNNTDLLCLNLSSTHNERKAPMGVVSADCTQTITESCPNLQYFGAQEIVFTNNSLLFLQYFPNLAILTLREVFENGSDLTEDSLNIILNHCRHLTHLDISDNQCIEGNRFNLLPKSLVFLNISGTACSRNIVLEMIFETCPLLEELHCADLEIDTEPLFLKDNVALKRLNVLSSVSNLLSANQLLIDFSKFNKLEVLQLSGHCLDMGLKNLENTSLQHLEIDYCYTLNGLHNFLDRLIGLKIQSLCCAGYDFANDNIISVVIESLTRLKYLKHLDLSCWNLLNADHIAALFKSLPDLQQLEITDCPKVVLSDIKIPVTAIINT